MAAFEFDNAVEDVPGIESIDVAKEAGCGRTVEDFVISSLVPGTETMVFGFFSTDFTVVSTVLTVVASFSVDAFGLSLLGVLVLSLFDTATGADVCGTGFFAIDAVATDSALAVAVACWLRSFVFSFSIAICLILILISDAFGQETLDRENTRYGIGQRWPTKKPTRSLLVAWSFDIHSQLIAMGLQF